MSHIAAWDVKDVTWRKSAHSGAAGHCVEVGRYGDGIVIRNSKDPGAGAMAFTGPEFSAFIDGVHDGEFDHLAV